MRFFFLSFAMGITDKYSRPTQMKEKVIVAKYLLNSSRSVLFTGTFC